jgi:hypothetical protein
LFWWHFKVDELNIMDLSSWWPFSEPFIGSQSLEYEQNSVNIRPLKIYRGISNERE